MFVYSVFLSIMNENQTITLVFIGIVIILMAWDIYSLIQYKGEKISIRNSITWTIVWISTAMLFSLFILYEAKDHNGFERFTQFQSAYWIEKSLSIDNLFVFLMVFKFFNVSDNGQHKVLLWGILGAMLLRGIFIFAGTWLIKLTYLPEFWIFVNSPGLGKGFERINPIILIFGIVLLVGGIKTLTGIENNEKNDFNNSRVVKMVRRRFPIDFNENSGKFWVRKRGLFFITKLFLVLIIVETTDLIFAVDSVPAIFSIAPDDPLILYSSNIFAIFGLRSLYFLLAHSMEKFSKLNIGVAIILVFIGLKMIIQPVYHIPTMFSLLVILSTLIITMLVSFRQPSESNN